MKKILLFLLFIFMSVVQSFAYDVEVDGIYYNLNNETCEAEVTYKEVYPVSTYSGSVVIPQTITSNGVTYSVTCVGAEAFERCPNLTSVTIPNTVTVIGPVAFSSCTSLTSIAIPNSVTNIGVLAFWNCSGLTSVTIPNSVTSIGVSAFDGCSSLPVIDNIRYADTYLVEVVDKGQDNYKIKVGTRFIGEAAFAGCSSLTSANIPNSVLSIGINAFHSCSSLTSIAIPNSVISIGGYAFSGCSSLTSITIPNSVISIGDYAFQNCSNLPVIDNIRYADTYLVEIIDKEQDNCKIKDGTRFIGSEALWGCSSLTSITIPNSVTSIQVHAFCGCSSLTSITIPDSVTGIEASAFWGCVGLTSVTIPNSITTIEHGTFSGCSGLTSVTIPNSVTSIESQAFSSCSGLTSVTIGKSVTSIGEWAFIDCSGLSDIYSLNTTPPACIKDDFGTFRFCDTANIRLHVPAGTKEAYISADVWCDFYNIIEDADESGITTPEIKECYGDAEYYTLDGVKVNASTTPSIYIVKKGDESKMIVVKK